MSMKNYEKFLGILTDDLNKMFEHQKEHLCCEEGCSLCCERGNFPFSKLEFDYLMEGFKTLDEDTKNVIRKNIQKIKSENLNSYTCPFLIDKKCSLYKYRGLICRTFGLLSMSVDNELTIPFCAGLGLNYSKYFDKEKQTISYNLVQSIPSKHPPRPFNINLNNLMSLDILKELDLEFGEVKRMIDWL